MKLFTSTCCIVLLSTIAVEAQKLNLLIGTYTNPGKSEGIYVYEFDASKGKASYKNKAPGLSRPAYLTLNKQQNRVYAVHELNEGKGKVSAFAFDKTSGALSLLNEKPSHGDDPCHITTDKDNKHVFVSNYSGGSLAVFPIQKDGSLGDAVQTEIYKANGTKKGRQEKSHAHSAVLSPKEDYLFVSDLGNNEVLAYKYSDDEKTPLFMANVTKSPEGSGPRHFVFHPNKDFAYSVQELTCSITAYNYKDGKLNSLQNISTLPPDHKGEKSSADIHISPDGKFLYASNRWDAHSIAMFSIGKDGTLSSIGWQPTLGKTPRNFVIDPTGNFLLAANQESDEVVVFRRNKKTGLLSDTGERIKVFAPVCLKFGM
jgi:6-phosphogluconolactonase